LDVHLAASINVEKKSKWNGSHLIFTHEKFEDYQRGNLKTLTEGDTAMATIKRSIW